MKLQQKIIEHHLENRQFEAAFHQIAKLNLTKDQEEELLELAQYSRKINETENSEKKASLETLLSESLSTFTKNALDQKPFEWTIPLYALLIMLGLEIIGFLFSEFNPQIIKNYLQSILGIKGYYFACLALLISTVSLLVYAFVIKDKYLNYFISNSELKQIRSSLTKRYSCFLQKTTSTPLALNLEIQFPKNKETRSIQSSLYNWNDLCF